jgi:tetratricopeptide (TPR) repeat protein
MDVRNEAEFTALRRILELSRGTSSFTTAVCNSPAFRETLFGELRSAGIPFLHATVVAGSLDPVEEVRAQIPSDSADALFITGLDYLLAESSADSDRLLAVLNRSRERWRSAFPEQPLVFWLTTHTSVRFTTHAPDLRAWISHELEFEDATISGIRPDQASLSRNFTWLSNLDAAAKRARLTDLDQRLSLDPPEPALFQEWARAWEEKITLLMLLGDYEKAEAAARQFLSAVTESATDFQHWKGEAASMLGDILEARGELDEALRLLREEGPPQLEQLDDPRWCAITLGRLAKSLQARGEIDQALHLLKEEVLPTFKSLEDARWCAITFGRIADILQMRGELDEALRIRREEELPVYERIGDVRSLLMGRTNLAVGLILRGRPEDSSELSQLLEWSYSEALRLHLPEAGQIRDLLQRIGTPEAVLQQMANSAEVHEP